MLTGMVYRVETKQICKFNIHMISLGSGCHKSLVWNMITLSGFEEKVLCVIVATH